MNRLFLIFVLLITFSCQQLVEKPANLIAEKKMSEMIVDLSLNDQELNFSNVANLEAGTRFIFKKHQVKPVDFVNSYKYYMVNRKMESILNTSQKILLERHPEAKKVIEQAQKQNENKELNQ